MKVQINRTILELVEGDITALDTDAIVNAAHGGGVAGVIARNFQYPQTGSTFTETPPASHHRLTITHELYPVKSIPGRCNSLRQHGLVVTGSAAITSG